MTTSRHETLSKYADDSELRIIELNGRRIIISVSLASQSGETWLIRSHPVLHLDMAPSMLLGRIEFGGLSLLPPAYNDNRNLDYGGEEDQYRVLHFVDDEGKDGYLVLYGEEEIIIPDI
jgi:hypothetical protein